MNQQMWDYLRQGGGLTTPASLLPNPFLFTLPQELWNKVKEPFYHPINVTVPASLAATGDFKVDGGTWFLILGYVATVRDTTNATVVTNVPQLVQITDQGPNAKFFSQSTDFLNVFGTIQQPAFGMLPRIINPNSTVQVDLQNLEATARNVRMLFLGAKIYNRDIAPMVA
jgi:hypothetical protein